jgi:hypothetical protein
VSENLRSQLITIAAGLARGTYLPGINTEDWYASTPVAERRRIIKALEEAEESHKLLAILLRRLADSAPDTHPRT